MEKWEIEIARFDADLKRRMKIIEHFEVTIDLESYNFTKSRIRRLLGFPNRFRMPWWRDHDKEWRERNRERVNEYSRMLYKKNGRRKRSYSELKKYQDAYYQRKKLKHQNSVYTEVVYTPE